MEQLTQQLLAPGSPLVEEIARHARASSDGLVRTAAELAPLAELTWQEHQTTDDLARRLRQLGWTVDTFAERSGLIARIGPPTSASPPIALRMELDALPYDGGARHLCGHHYHMAAVLTAAEILTGLSRRFGLQVVVLGQPAEEAGTSYSGADFMIEHGGLQHSGRPVRGVLAFHGLTGLKYGQIAVLDGGGPFYAGTGELIATISAPGGHGGRPHTTRRTNRIFREFLTSVEDAIYFGSLSPYHPVVFGFNSEHVGQRFNMIATEGEARGNLRWFAAQTPERAKQLWDEVVDQYNTIPGIQVSVEFEPGYQPTIVDPLLARYMAQAAGQVAIVVPASPTTLAEDMGKYWTVGGVPVGFATVGLGERDYPEDKGIPNPFEHHSRHFDVSQAAEAHLWQGSHMLIVSALMTIAAGE
jgi:hippurate hydrolase